MGKDSEVAINIDNVSKSFKLPHEKKSSIKSIIVNPFRRTTYEKQEVLKNIDFKIKKGEFFGIVGRNGSGKSTMLKLLAGIYSPDSGSIEINGKLTPFIELGVGFNPELTGRENVYLNGALLGFNRDEVDKLYEDIVSFAELERFMDQKLKNYSSGMQVRLAFSIATRAKRDVLLIDEVLAVGDANFQKKCFDYFYSLKEQKKTVVFVSHDMEAIRRFCDRALMMEDGQIKVIGSVAEVSDEYVLANVVQQKNKSAINEDKDNGILEVSLLDNHNKEKSTITESSEVKLRIKFKNFNSNQELNIGVGLFTESGVYIFGYNTQMDGKPINGGSKRVDLILGKLPLQKGQYYFNIVMFTTNETSPIDFVPKAIKFNVKPTYDKPYRGIINVTHDWEYDE